jgi:hypothetical protein
MTLYYHEDTVAKSYDYTLVGAARVNHQQHDFSGSSAGMQLQDSSYHDSLTYIQAMAGLKANLSFPYLSNLISSGKIVINKAELVITVGSFQDTATFPVTGTLLLLAYDENGGLTYLTDFLDQGITFGGIYGIPTPHTYKFNIGRHLQRILDGNLANNGFSLNIISSVVQADRAVIGSGKSLGGNTAKMKLNLYYTKL